MNSHTQHSDAAARAGIGLAVVTLVGGVWGAGLVTPNVFVHGAVTAVLFAGMLVLVAFLYRGSELRRVAVGALVVTLAVMLAVGALLSRPKAVNEDIVRAQSAAPAEPAGAMSKGGKGGEPAGAMSKKPVGNVAVASASFESLAHKVEGKVTVVRLPDGSQKLTLEDFSTDPGPDLYVIAAPGNPSSDSEVKDYVELGRLKGTEGNQQYDLPEGFDAAKNGTIYIWCRAFTVGFGRAQLQA